MDFSSVLDFLSFENKKEKSYDFYFDFKMSECCSFKVGGNARLAIFPLNGSALESLLRFLDKKTFKYKLIGNGTNVIPSDGGFDGALIITTRLSSYSFNGNILYAECGAPITKLARKSGELSLSGMENLCGIPASVGGAVYMNSGAYNSQISDILLSAKCYNHETCKIEEYTNEEMQFSYRSSICHYKKITVISAVFKLAQGNADEINSRMNEVMKKRKDAQPLNFPNAGSIFKRPPNNFAGKLIEEAGLKGYSIGGAEVSTKHAGFIINRGGAKAEDVQRLIEYVKEKVLENSGVSLECEVEFF
jgi:UDP-N-acetylmuramate dehydrogenase